MGSFGNAVTSLLDVYTKYLSLLEQHRQNGQPDKSRRKLGSSIRSDRARVHRAYSTSLSQQGTSFERGDATARMSLRQVVKKLTQTIEALLHSVMRKKRQSLDYESLGLLSNASREDAIRTMSDLSRRVGSQSSLASRSSRTTKSSPTSRPRAKHSRRPPGAEARGPSDSHRENQARRPSKSSQERRDKRVSILTMSSDSTKLGEVRWRRGNHHSNEYGRQPTYPLYAPSKEPEKKKTSRRWFGLF